MPALATTARIAVHGRQFLLTLPVPVVTALAVTLTGCGGSDESAPPPPSPAAPQASSPSADAEPSGGDPQSAAEKEVLDVYEHYWAEQVRAYAKGDDKGTDLEKYATAEALARSLRDLLSMRQAGNVTEGTPLIAPEVTAISLKEKIPKATVSDCLDISGWHTVNEKTRKKLPRPPQPPERYAVSVTAEKWENQWIVTQATTQYRTCEPSPSSSQHPPSP